MDYTTPERVQNVVEELDAVRNPDPKIEGDWEVLHDMQDTAFAHAVGVMIDFPLYRERILARMLLIVEQHIPRW